MHNPTPESRGAVKALASVGITQVQIGKYLGLDTAVTVRKYYREALDKGCTLKVAEVAATLFDLAINGNVTACIFIMKTQGLWKETKEEEATNEAPEPITKVEIVSVEGTVDPDLK